MLLLRYWRSAYVTRRCIFCRRWSHEFNSGAPADRLTTRCCGLRTPTGDREYGRGVSEGIDPATQRALIRRDRVRTWTQILGASAVMIAAVTLGALVGLHVGVLISVIIPAGAWLLHRRMPSPRPLPPPLPPPRQRSADGVTFSNIAFSTSRPTWRGWRRDVGLLRITPAAVVLSGLNGDLTITHPIRAEVHDEKYGYWPFVKLTGRIEGSDGSSRVEVLLGVRGYPRSKFSSDPDEIAHETQEVCTAINTR